MEPLSLHNQGDHNNSYETFVQLLSRHEQSLRALVFTLLPEMQLADEVIQESCLVLWRKFAEFEPNSDFLAWVCTVARFMATMD